MFAKSLLALAFVPLEDVEIAYELLSRTCPEGDKIDKFNNYFKRTYVGKIIFELNYTLFYILKNRLLKQVNNEMVICFKSC